MKNRILVVAPLIFEMKAICAYFHSQGSKGTPIPGKTESLWFESLQLEIAVGGHGKAKLAAITQYLIARGDLPEAVIVAGAAGALHTDVTIGDIILATETIEHDYKMRFGRTRPAPRHQGDRKLQRDLKAAHPLDATYKMFGGAIASGDEDIVARERAKELYTETGALCVAWEGAGGFKAATFNELPFLEIRAITDTADSAATADFAKTLGGALGNIGRALFEWRKQCSA